MSKKIQNLKWESVAVDGFPIELSEKFNGFAGLEECTTYGLDKESKRPRKKKEPKKKPEKRKTVRETSKPAIPAKKVKLTNGFIVESFNNTTKPSLSNDLEPSPKKSKKNKNRKKKSKADLTTNTTQPTHQDKTLKTSKKEVKNVKTKLGEDVGNNNSCNLTPEDMLTWAEFKLQEPIMKALTELGFQKPTKIQQLTLPAAIHGRRDILGAAETGSGKTLAFGLPILSGILKLKEKAQLKGLDVYDIPYKKLTNKNKNKESPVNKIKINKKQNKAVKQVKTKESSEDGYSSGDENDEDEIKLKPKQKINNKNKKAKIREILNKSSDDDFLEEIEVPITKRNANDDESDSEDDENYIHLSEMLDSDDLAESSNDEKDNSPDENESVDENEVADEENDSTNDNDENEETDSGDEEILYNNNHEDEESGVEDDVEAEMDVDEIELGDDETGTDDDETEMADDETEVDAQNVKKGIGCVKVVDNIEIPGHVVTKTGKPLYALILTPTRELAIQISRHLIAAAKYTGIRIATIVGGMAAVKQERVLRSGPEVVVATPGRLWELINQGHAHLQQLSTVKFLAIDETDRMIERGHFEELTPLLERLNVDEDHKSSRQNFVFSATLTMVHDLPTHLKGKKVTKRGKIINRKIEKMTPQQKIQRLIKMIGMTEPKVVDITTQNLGTSESLTECRIACSKDHKDSYLYYLLKQHPGRTIVFCNSIGSVRRLAQILTILKCNPLPLHASMPQRQRLKNLERFRDSPHGLLIATDVAARGLDIPDVDHVIQYQVPRTAENYVHRSGRTARAMKEGLNVLMVEPEEAYLYSKLCHTLNKTSEVPHFPVDGHTLAPLRELVQLARDLDALELKRRRVAQAQGWKDKAARDMDMILDDDDVPVKAHDPSLDRAVKIKRKQLAAMLSRPVFPRGFSFKYPTLNDPTALENKEENALQVMKKAIETGELKKDKRISKNAPLLKLGKKMNNKIKKKK